MLYVATMQLLHYNKLQPAKQVYFDTLPLDKIMPQRSLPKYIFSLINIFHLMFSSLDQNYEIS